MTDDSLAKKICNCDVPNDYFKLKEWDSILSDSLQVKVAGYPEKDGYQYLALGMLDKKKLSNHYSHGVDYNIKTSGGSSGSPVWIENEDDSFQVVAIHGYIRCSGQAGVAGSAARRAAGGGVAGLAGGRFLA